MWYNGKALTIKEFIDRAKLFKFECVELDCRVPHAVPFFLDKKDRQEIVAYLDKKDIQLAALAANNDFSSPVTEHREANIQMVVDMIQLCKDLGAPVLRIFTAWMGSSFLNGRGTYDVARPGYARAFPQIPEMDRWKYCLEAFKIVTRFAEEAGVSLALQNHPPVVRNSADCLAIAEEINSPFFNLSFDISGERAWQDTNLVLEQARKIGKRWVHSHYGGDYRRNPDGSIVNYPLGRAMGPREGNMSWNTDAWIQSAFENGYTGAICYEGCTPTYTRTGDLIPIETMDERVEMARDFMLALYEKYEPKEK
jgi:sugar phosphate isomerase/epimerase